MRNRIKPSVAIILAITILAGFAGLMIQSKPDRTTYAADAIHEVVGTTQVKVMSFNIWIGGSVVDFNKVIEAIKISGADACESTV